MKRAFCGVVGRFYLNKYVKPNAFTPTSTLWRKVNVIQDRSFHRSVVNYSDQRIKNVSAPVPVEGEESLKTVGKMEASQKLYLSFKCTVCNGSHSYTISKRAYNHGVVIVTCNGCSNNHLIADNLGWFSDVEGKNIEEILEKKGEKVVKMISSEVKEIVPE